MRFGLPEGLSAREAELSAELSREVGEKLHWMSVAAKALKGLRAAKRGRKCPKCGTPVKAAAKPQSSDPQKADEIVRLHA